MHEISKGGCDKYRELIFFQMYSVKFILVKKMNTRIIWTSGQDGGIGRYTLPPHTTKRRKTTNLKTKNNQTFQKIELYGSPTTTELKKKHSFRLVGGAEMASWAWRGCLVRHGVEDQGRQGGGWWTR